jgi:hypothetical protein
LLHSLRFAILMIKYLCSIVSLSYDYYVLGHCIGWRNIYSIPQNF